MFRPFLPPVWKTAPFVRLLLPLITGIIIQWYLPVPFMQIVVALCAFLASCVIFGFLPIALKFKGELWRGLIVNALWVCIGLFICWQKDIRKNQNWFGKYYHDSDYLVVRINEPLIAKNRSFKAEGFVESLVQRDSARPCEGKLWLYFSKDSPLTQLQYGDRILIHKSLQAIKNSGNPGAFNYTQYAAFQQVFHQVFLNGKDWVKLDKPAVDKFRQFIFTARMAILSALRKNMPPGKDELGLAEALLIGYTNDLDKDLVQAYSNTGVVHIIAISGMHLALIYVMLVWLFTKIPGIKNSKLLQAIMILSCLWLFSLLTGAAASVLRAAVMFSFITIGKQLDKQANMYNSLASSAFVLLCYNPFFLWDVGFQLSYLAIIGIVVFQKSVYNLLNIRNRWINECWKMVSVSIAAQVLTLPVCIYYFHQIPLLFLPANIIAVPLSGFILYAEIATIALYWVPIAASVAGQISSWLVWLMNKSIAWISRLGFAIWDNIPATLFSTVILFAVIISFTQWLKRKNIWSFRLALKSLLFLVMYYAFIKWQAQIQEKLIVYHIPQHGAADFICGENYYFKGDSVLRKEGTLKKFHLKPARTSIGLKNETGSLPLLFRQGPFCQFNKKRILFIDRPWVFEQTRQKIAMDIIIISQNPKLAILQLAKVFDCNQYVFDASNSLWKIGKWQAECSALHLQGYSVPEKGAFVWDIGD